MNNPLAQVLNDGANTYLYGNGRIAQYSGANTDYFLPDGLGSERQLANAAGAVTLARRYDPYGGMLSSVGSGASVFGFAGEQTDNTGLEYLRARYYVPAQGRFFQHDSWEGDMLHPQSLNPYAYVGGNPVLYIDPTGECSGLFSWIRHTPGGQINCDNRDAAWDVWTNEKSTYGQRLFATTIYAETTLAYTGAIAGGLVLGKSCAGGALGGVMTQSAIDWWTGQQSSDAVYAGQAAAGCAIPVAGNALKPVLGTGIVNTIAATGFGGSVYSAVNQVVENPFKPIDVEKAKFEGALWGFTGGTFHGAFQGASQLGQAAWNASAETVATRLMNQANFFGTAGRGWREAFVDNLLSKANFFAPSSRMPQFENTLKLGTRVSTAQLAALSPQVRKQLLEILAECAVPIDELAAAQALTAWNIRLGTSGIIKRTAAEFQVKGMLSDVEFNALIEAYHTGKWGRFIVAGSRAAKPSELYRREILAQWLKSVPKEEQNLALNALESEYGNIDIRWRILADVGKKRGPNYHDFDMLFLDPVNAESVAEFEAFLKARGVRIPEFDYEGYAAHWPRPPDEWPAPGLPPGIHFGDEIYRIEWPAPIGHGPQ